MIDSTQYTPEQLRELAEVIKQAPEAEWYRVAGERIDGRLARNLAKEAKKFGPDGKDDTTESSA